MSENRYPSDPPRRKKHWKPVALLGRARAVEDATVPPGGHVDDFGQVWENHDETPIRGDLPPMRGRR